jgi:DNA-binding YbaB/EbfC family protein
MMTSPNPMEMIARMQASMAAAQAELASSKVEATVGGGVVRATVSGDGDLLAIKIDPSVVDPDDIETLEDLVVAGVVEATRQARELQAEKLGAATGGIDLGSVLGDFGFGFGGSGGSGAQGEAGGLGGLGGALEP